MSLRRRCALLSLVDCDDLKVEWDGSPRFVRLMDVDPERAVLGGSKPTTEFGRRTLQRMRQTLFEEVDEIELEFPGNDVELSNSGRLLGYVHIRGENLNARMVREGWSLCCEKYGRPRIHRAEMERAEMWARAEGRGLWGLRSGLRDYAALKAHWQIRAGQVDDFRHAIAMGEDILNSRLDYPDILARARSDGTAQVFAELTRCFCFPDGSIHIQLGNPQQPLAAVFPASARSLARFLEREFIGHGKPNYLYFNGSLTLEGERPQMRIDRLDQVCTHPTLA